MGVCPTVKVWTLQRKFVLQESLYYNTFLDITLDTSLLSEVIFNESYGTYFQISMFKIALLICNVYIYLYIISVINWYVANKWSRWA